MELVEDVHGDHHIGFEEGRIWLPTNVLDEAVFNNNQPKDFLLPQQYHYQRRHDHNTSFPSSDAVLRVLFFV
ncbi:hypothetical protein Syun_007515 [Stephania yunnanensis]|uniref:Uncharacterized protein n=1 Tax=Stephania yunnanensis TaxID=152371 RepID=A0AAP0L295_9MAGN